MWTISIGALEYAGVVTNLVEIAALVMEDEKIKGGQ